MATRNPDERTVVFTWLELSEILSKAGILLPDEDIANLTLTHPRNLLIHTSRRVKATAPSSGNNNHIALDPKTGKFEQVVDE